MKNTLFKLGKVKNNSIQIYQVKNASLLEFESIERSIVNNDNNNASDNRISKIKTYKNPHFGPLKGAALASRKKYQSQNSHSSSQQLRGET